MNCLELAQKAAKDRLTEQEILDAFERAGKIREKLIEAGKTDNLDARVAGIVVREAMAKKIEAARMRRQIAQNIRTRKQLDPKVKAFMDAGMSPVNAIKTLNDGTQKDVFGGRDTAAGRGQGYEARWISSVTSTIQRERPHIFKLFTNRQFDDDVTREMWELDEGGSPGSTKNKDAEWLAPVLAAAQEMSRTEINMLGGAIGDLGGYAGVQTHDDIAMLKVTDSQWVDYVFQRLDWLRSFPDVETEAEVREILTKIYHTIITGVSNDSSPILRGERVGPANLARKLGAHRVLHFKNADAAIEYRDKFGRGSTIQGIFSSLIHQSKMAGAMDMFGPNPKAMILSIAARVRKDLKKQVETLPPGKKRDKLVKWTHQLDEAGGEISSLTGMIERATQLHNKPVDITIATIGTSIRVVQGIAKLGGAVLTAIPSDTASAATAAMFRGQGFAKGLMSFFGELANHKNGKEISLLINEGADGLTGHLSSAFLDGTPGRLSRAAQLFYKITGLSGWTDFARAAAGRSIAAHLGMNVDKPFDKLDPAHQMVFKMNAITEAKWDALRSGAVRHVNGRSYLTPDVARTIDESLIERIVQKELDDAKAAILKPTKAGNVTQAMLDKFEAKRAMIIKRGRLELELDLHRYYADETSYSIIETDPASRAFAGLGNQRPGTVASEAIKMVMQFKGFPIAYTMRILGRARLAPKGRGVQAMHIGTLLAGMTVAGYISMMAKDVARGLWPPRDPFSWKTLGAAALQGGALGIYGDFLFGTRSRFGSGLIETASGPFIGTLNDTWKIIQDLKEGNPKASLWLDLVVNNAPYVNIFWARTALDILFINSLRELARPGYLRRQAATIKGERGQEFFMPRTVLPTH